MQVYPPMHSSNHYMNIRGLNLRNPKRNSHAIPHVCPAPPGGCAPGATAPSEKSPTRWVAAPATQCRCAPCVSRLKTCPSEFPRRARVPPSTARRVCFQDPRAKKKMHARRCGCFLFFVVQTCVLFHRKIRSLCSGHLLNVCSELPQPIHMNLSPLFMTRTHLTFQGVLSSSAPWANVQ